MIQVWHGTVGQIEDHYGIKHLGVKVRAFLITKDQSITIQQQYSYLSKHLGVEVEGVKTQEQFMRVVRPLLVEHNQVSLVSFFSFFL